MERALDAARTSTFTEEEVSRARNALLKNIELTLNNSEFVGYELTEWAAMGDWRLFFIHRDRIAKVTPADVQRAASTYLKPSNRTVAAFVPTATPDRAEIQAAPNVAALVADYRGSAVVQTGEAFEATPKNIDSRTKRSRLPSGMHVSLLSKETRGNRVVANIGLRHGTAQTLMGKFQVASITSGLMSRGTTQLTRQQVKDSTRQAQGPGVHGRRDEQPHRVHRNAAREHRAGARPGGASAQVAALRRRGVRQAEARTHHQPRADQVRAAVHRQRRARPQAPADAQGPHSLHVDRRRTAGRHQRRDARSGEGVPSGVLRRLVRGRGGHRRLRRSRGERRPHAQLRRLEEPAAVRARGAHLRGHRLDRGIHRDARQGQRRLFRGAEPRPARRRSGLSGDVDGGLHGSAAGS